MKKIDLKNLIGYLVMVFSLCILFYLPYFYFFYQSKNQQIWYDNCSFIGHAMYGIDNNDYTNSYEAFELGYHLGIRIMEADFAFTSDHKLVLVHFWKENTSFSQAVSYNEFINSKINNKFSTLDLEKLLNIMKKYPDLYIIIDTKEENYLSIYETIVSECKKYDSSLLNKFIPQLFQFDDYKKIKQIYPFKSYIFTLYKMNSISIQKIVYFSLIHNIEVIAIPMDYIENRLVSTDDIAFIKSKNLKIYVYTINDFETYNTLLELGIDGVYTDFLY